MIYNLPASMDPEGLSYATTIISGPSFVSLISNDKQLKIYPSKCLTDFGNFTVIIKLEDEYPASSLYSIDF